MKRVAMMLVLVSVLVWVGGTQAVLIKNGSTQLFSDNFESYPIEADPASPPWVINKNGGGNSVYVHDYLPANEGTKFLRIRRWEQSWDRVGEAIATFTAQSSGTLRATFALYPEATAVNGADIEFQTAGGNTGAALLYKDDFKVYNLSGGWQDTGLTLNQGAWNTVTISYDLAAGKVSYTVNGISANNLNAYASGLTIDRLYFGGAANGTNFLIDAVPEPATIGLLVFGGLTILRRRG